MKKFELKPYLLTVLAAWLLLSLGLFSGMFALVDTFSLTVEPAFLLGLCLLCALGSALVYAVPRADLRVGLVCLLCALLALFVWRRWEDFANGAQVLFYQISYGFHQAIPSILYYELPRAFSRSEQRECATVFLTAAVPLLALWLGPWLTLSWPVWPAAGAVAGLVSVPLFILREPSLLSLAAFLLFLSLVILTRRSYRDSASIGARRVLTALIPTALVLTLLGTAIPVNANPRPRWLEDLRLSVQRLSTADFSVGVGGVGSPTPGEQPFGRVGPLKFDGHTILQVKSSSIQRPLFLRGFSAGRYTAEGWMQLDTDSDPYPLGGFTDARHPFSFPYQSQPTVETATVLITDKGSNTDYYYIPYYPSQLLQDGIFVEDSYLEHPSGVNEYTFSFAPQREVRVADAGSGAVDAAFYDAQVEYSRWVYRHYLDVPYDLLSGEATQMIQDFAGSHALSQPGPGQTLTTADNAAQIVALTRQLSDYLASFTEYDQSVSATPAGEDFVSYFLTTSQKGYCVHYATSAVLFFRACGLPARYAAGYVARPRQVNKVSAVPDQNAHAWVEVYVRDFGWMPADVTPGFSGGGRLTDPSVAETTPTPSAAPPSAIPTPTPTPKPTPSPTAPSPTPTKTPNKTTLSPAFSRLLSALLRLLIVFLLIGLIYLQYRLRLGHLRKKCTDPNPNLATIALYRYLVKLAHHTKSSPPQKAVDLAQKAHFSQHIITPDELSTMQALARNHAQAAEQTGFFPRLLLKFIWAVL